MIAGYMTFLWFNTSHDISEYTIKNALVSILLMNNPYLIITFFSKFKQEAQCAVLELLTCHFAFEETLYSTSYQISIKLAKWY
jgi:hypothetical protein